MADQAAARAAERGKFPFREKSEIRQNGKVAFHAVPLAEHKAVPVRVFRVLRIHVKNAIKQAG